MNRFLPSLLTVTVALGLGFLVGTLFRRYAKDPETLPRWRIRAQKLSLLILNPIAFVGAVWILPTGQGGLILLPIVGFLTLAFGFFAGQLAIRFKPLPTPGQQIAFPLSCSFTNIGNLGGLIVFLLLGELAYSLVPLYKLFEEFWYYGVLFPFARQKAIRIGLIEATGVQRNALLRVISDPFFVVVMFSILLGLTFNLFGFERPEIYGKLNAWLIPSSSFVLLLAVGSQIRVGSIPRYWKPALAITLIRGLMIPCFAIGLALLLGLGSGDALPLKTIAILAVMPMAFMSLVPASLFNLDSELVSTAWIFSTCSLLLSVPLLSFVLNSS